VLALLSTGLPAAAACRNVCEHEPPTYSATPPLACAALSVSADGCDCGVTLMVSNLGCPGWVSSDLTFDSCSSGGPCDTLTGDTTGHVAFRVTEVGDFHKTITLSDEQGDHRVDVAVKVTGFGSGCACSSLPRRGGATSGAIALMLAAAWFARRSRAGRAG
jgi:hypothetical protein